MRRFALAAAAWLVAVSCSPAPATAAECHPTVARMTPPEEAVVFFARGDPDATRKLNWLGNEAMWVILPPDGEIVGRLDDKIAPFRVKRGVAEYEAREIGGPGVVSRHLVGSSGYGDIGFQSGGPTFPHVGCWQVTYLVGGMDPLVFVVKVR